jgi:hypothetical protein
MLHGICAGIVVQCLMSPFDTIVTRIMLARDPKTRAGTTSPLLSALLCSTLPFCSTGVAARIQALDTHAHTQVSSKRRRRSMLRAACVAFIPESSLCMPLVSCLLPLASCPLQLASCLLPCASHISFLMALPNPHCLSPSWLDSHKALPPG